MKLSELKKRMNNLEKIKEIVEISKFDALQKLNQATRNRKYHFSIVEKALEILTFVKHKYNLKSPFIQKNNKKKDKKVLWVFLTIDSSVLKMSYASYEKIILEKINKETDQILTIGKHAKVFASKNHLESIEHFDSFKKNTQQIISLLNGVTFSFLFDKIKLVSYSPQFSNKQVQDLFPINISKEKSVKSYLNKLRFYPSINKIVESLSNSFIHNLVSIMFQESYEFFYRSKLLKNEESLTNIENLLQNIKREINKTKRKKTTSELIHIGQIVKAKGK